MATTQTALDTPHTRQQPGRHWSWFEAFAIALMPIGIGYGLHPDDPFFLRAEFNWLTLAPLLLGLGYGLTAGLAGAALQVACLFAASSGLLPVDPIRTFPTDLILALVVVGAASGEFRDRWARKLEGIQSSFEYETVRVAKFFRDYHLLRVSHERLERELSGSKQTIRTALTQLSKQFNSQSRLGQSRELRAIAPDLMQFLCSVSPLAVGAMYEVDGNQTLNLPAVAAVGKPGMISSQNPLVLECLRSGQAVTAKALNDNDLDKVLAVFPLKDFRDQIWAVLVVEEMSFLSFNETHIRQLAILCEHLGDMIMEWKTGSPEETHLTKGMVAKLLQRHRRDAGYSGSPATLALIRVDPRAYAAKRDSLTSPNHWMLDWELDGLRKDLRCTDKLKVLNIPDCCTTLFLSLPFTNQQGGKQFMARFERRLAEYLGCVATENGAIETVLIPVHAGTRADEVFRVIQEFGRVRFAVTSPSTAERMHQGVTRERSKQRHRVH